MKTTQWLTPASAPEWLDARKLYLTASEAAALYGAGREDLYSLWHSKKHGWDGETGDNPAMKWGRQMEPIIIAAVCEHSGWTREPLDPWTCAVIVDPPMLATPDAIAINEHGERVLVEAKALLQPGARADTEDDLRHSTWIQVQQQMGCSSIHRAVVASSIVGGSPRVVDVPFDAEWWARHVEYVGRFWEAVHNHDECPFPPTDSGASGRALARLWPRDNGEVVELPDEAAQKYTEYQAAHETEKKASGEKDKIKRWMQHRVGEASIGRIPGTGMEYRWQLQESKPVLCPHCNGVVTPGKEKRSGRFCKQPKGYRE